MSATPLPKSTAVVQRANALWPRTETLAVSVVILIAALLVMFGLAGYPLMRTDAPALLSPAINFARGDGLTTTLFALLPFIDPGLRLVYHGFLVQQLLGSLILAPEGYWLLLLSQVANAASVLLLGLYLRNLAIGRHARPHRSVWVGIVLACAATAAILATKLGRPEEIALLIVLATLIMARWQPEREPLIMGVGLGLLGATTPIVALHLATLVIAYFGTGRAPKAALAAIATCGAVSIVLVLALAVIVYPYPTIDWLRGLVAHSKFFTPNQFFSGGYVAHYFLNTDFPLLAFTLALSLGFTVGWLYLNWVTIRAKWIFGAGVGLFALITIGQCMQSGDRVYSWFPLLPMVYAPIIGVLSHDGKGRSSSWRYAVLALMALPALGLARLAVLYGWFTAEGMSYSDAQHAVNAIYAAQPGKIRISDSLFVLFDDLERLEVQRPETNPAIINTSYLTGRPYDLLILQENLEGLRTPPTIKGYDLVEDRFTHLRPTLLGVPIANTTPGYQFAVYRRSDGAPASAAAIDVTR